MLNTHASLHREVNLTDKPNYDYLAEIQDILLKMDGE